MSTATRALAASLERLGTETAFSVLARARDIAGDGARIAARLDAHQAELERAAKTTLS